MTLNIHRLTLKQFARALVMEARRRRVNFRGDRHGRGNRKAEVAGYDHRSVWRWEKGYRQPTLQQALDVLEAQEL